MPARNLTFLPPDGTFNYDKEEHYKDLHASTPIPLNDLPLFLMDGFFHGVHPPKLWCGWPLGGDGAFKLIEDHFPEEISYDVDGNPQKSDAIASLRGRIYQEFQIPPEHQARVQLPDMGDEDGETLMMLCVGWNHPKFGPFKEYIESIRYRLFGGKEAQWYLCAHDFEWRGDENIKPRLPLETVVGLIRKAGGVDNTEAEQTESEATSAT